MPTDYYSIDELLAGQQKIQCTFEETAPGLGFLEGNETRDVRQCFAVLFVGPCSYTFGCGDRLRKAPRSRFQFGWLRAADSGSLST